MQIVNILRRGINSAVQSAALARFRPQHRAGGCGKEDGRAVPARSGRLLARGRSRVRRERDHDEVQAEAGSVARRSPTPRTRRAPHRRRLRAWPNGRAVLRILARLAATRAHNHRAVCEVRGVVGAAGTVINLPPISLSCLLVRYRPAEGTASGGIGCNVRRHDRDRAAARSKRFVSVLCCLAGARSCCGTDDDGASPPPPPSLLRRLLSLDLLRHLSVRARDAARRHALGGDDRDLDRDQGRERHLPEPEPAVPVPADGARDHGHGHGRGRHRPAPTSLRVAHVNVMSRVALRRHVSPVGWRRHDHDHDNDDQRSAVGGQRSVVGGRRPAAGDRRRRRRRRRG